MLARLKDEDPKVVSAVLQLGKVNMSHVMTKTCLTGFQPGLT